MAPRFDDELPDPVKVPQPGGWYELFCCSTILLVILAGLIVIAIVR